MLLDHSLPSVRWSLQHENSTSNLFGRAVVNSSTGAADETFLRIEFHDPSSGLFQTGEDDESFQTLFSFSFSQVKGSVPMSAGFYNGGEVAGDEKATYLLQAASPDRFTLTVTPRSFDLAAAAVKSTAASAASKKKATSDDDDELTSNGPASTGHPSLSQSSLKGASSYVYVGHRIKREEEKTLLQKYGTMVLLGAMLLLNLYMRTRQSASQMTQAQNVARANAAIAAGAARGGKSRSAGVQIEEITEGSAGTKKDS